MGTWSLVAVAVVAAWAVHGVDAHAIARDARLTRPLVELLAHAVDDAAMDAAVHHTLVVCRTHGVGGIVARDGRDPAEQDVPVEDVEFCHRVRFVRHARQRHRARDAAIRQRLEVLDADKEEPQELPQDATPLLQNRPDRVVPSVEVRRAEDLDYQTFFETFAERNAPLVVTQPSALQALGFHGQGGEDDGDVVASFLTACFPSNDHRGATMQITDSACVSWLDKFQVPLVAVNNFVPRTELATHSAFLPTLLTVAEASSEALPPHQVGCPFGLHTVLLAVDGDVEYQLLDAQFMPFAPPHDYDDRPSEAAYAELSVSADGMAAWPTSDLSTDRFGAIPSDTLPVGGTLFVPGATHAVALSGASRVLRFCVVDASNLNHVTETLRVDALVSRLARKLFLALQAPGFDASMARRPSVADTLWANYLLWPKEAKRLVKRRDMVSAESEHVPMSRRERLKLWQEDKRWERRIKSRTLPVPLPPVVMNATRHTVTLRWQDLYERQRNDITAYGYEVRWRREDVAETQPEIKHNDPDADIPTQAGDITDDPDRIVYEGAVNFTHAELVRSAMPTTLFGDAFDGKDIEGVVRGLAPEAVYLFTVRLYVDETFGVASERSRSVQTAPCSVPERVPGVVIADVNASGACLNVRWLEPNDNGGRRVTSYLFALTFVGESRLAPLEPHKHHERLSVLTMPQSSSPLAPKRPRGSPTWLSGSVCDQLPGRVRVRVAAVNAIGVGPWSDPSAPMEMGTETPLQVPTVRGHGDPAFLVSHDSLFNSPASSTRLPRILLSDVLEQVVVALPNATSESRFAVWAGHFSPRRFHVSAELVLADPPDASQPLRNAADVRDRVVLIVRGGGVPFLFKLRHAQRAGALGVVFADDARDRCARGFDQSCVAGASQRHGEGFGASDRHALWRDARIPFVLAQRTPSAALLELLR